MKKPKNNTQLTEDQTLELNGYAIKVNLLQNKIITNDNVAIKHGKLSVELAIKAGDFLRKAKKLAGHGHWKTWMKEKCSLISERTIQNYMALAGAAAVAAERKSHNPTLVTFLDEAQSLREAYIGAGIIKVPKLTKTTVPEITPERMKKEQAAKYDALLNEGRQHIAEKVRNTINAAKCGWDLSKWTMKNGKPCSDDGPNWASRLFHDLASFVALRNNPSLTTEDEVYSKTRIALTEVVKVILIANSSEQTTPAPAPLTLASIPQFSMELNTTAVEVADAVTA